MAGFGFLWLAALAVAALTGAMWLFWLLLVPPGLGVAALLYQFGVREWMEAWRYNRQLDREIRALCEAMGAGR